jgi:aerobic-type carbon monoxide dehydrogenase small subunit (CoxS/CutS family)
LLDTLREAGCLSVKRGCESGDCGSCCVLMNGEPISSCMVPSGRLEGQTVTTLEGLADDELMQKLQKAFIDGGAVQCGYCTPGMLLVIWATLKEGGELTEADVRHALSGNLCRCTGYAKPIQAVMEIWEAMS